MTRREEMAWRTGVQLGVDSDTFGHILALAADIVVSIDRDGVVLEVTTNASQQTLGCLDHWAGRSLKDFLTEECHPKLDALLRGLAQSAPRETRRIQLNHVDNATWEYPIDYTAFVTESGGSILLIGRDLRPVAEIQQQLVKAQTALERDYESYRDFDTRYRVVMAATKDALVFVDATTGRIEDANAAAAILLGADVESLVGSQFVQEFEDRRRSEFMDALNVAATASGSAPIVAEGRRQHESIKIFPSLFRAAGQKTLLCRLESAAQAQPLAEELGTNLRDLYTKGLEAVVFTNVRGAIRAANESFLNLSDVATFDGLKGKSLADFLVRGNVDLKILVDNVSRAGRIRTFATKLQTSFGSQRPVEISATYLGDRSEPVVGLVIRDASRSEPALGAASGAPSDVTKNVMQLVGSSPLKDIVAATTDVIERICIETAVELTRNNRVAAAEMLGLSRQSLYVKLRKYGLLDRPGKD